MLDSPRHLCPSIAFAGESQEAFQQLRHTSCTAVQSLPALKNQRIVLSRCRRDCAPSKHLIISSHLSRMVMLLSTLLLLAQQPRLVASRSIAGISLSEQQHSHQEFAHTQTQQLIDSKEASSLRSSGENLIRSRRSSRLENDPEFWPNQTIPFVFEEPFPKRYKAQVMKAISVWHKRTCIRFVDRTDEEYFVKFTITEQVCKSQVGLKRYLARYGRQFVDLSSRCLKDRGQIIHELGHLIGFYHEHQRPDRDRYLQVNTQNIPRHLQNQFHKLSFTTYGEYDFHSIMHYGFHHLAYSNTSSMTLLPNVTVPRSRAGMEVGHIHTLSRGDYLKARKMYRCPPKEPVVPPTITTAAATAVPMQIASNNIYTAEKVALSVSGSNFDSNSWLSCTEQSCAVNTCPGRFFREEDVSKCPENVFYLYRVAPGTTRRMAGVVLVGDTIILERVYTSSSSNRVHSSFLSCDPDSMLCSLSDLCIVDEHTYNSSSYCREHLLIIRAEGKVPGEAVTDRDLVGFEFQATHDGFFEQRCALGCDPASKACLKERCIFTGSNSLDGSNPTDEAPVCGMDMFSIRKY